MANFSVNDPEGDADLVCGETEFQVSSKVLSLASPSVQGLRKASGVQANPVASNFMTMTLRAYVSCSLPCITRALALMPLVWRDLRILLSSLISRMHVHLREILL